MLDIPNNCLRLVYNIKTIFDNYFLKISQVGKNYDCQFLWQFDTKTGFPLNKNITYV